MSVHSKMGLRMQPQLRFGVATVARTCIVAAVAMLGASGAAHAQGKDLSDKSIGTLMDYAWAITPGKFTLPSGKTIEVDKNNRDSAMVPLETARDIVRTGRLSANAQICGLMEEQASNYQTLMAREVAKAKWTDQQTLYISQLHLFTVMMLTGKVAVVAGEGEDKNVKIEETAKPDAKAPTCSDAEREKVKAQIIAYVGTDAAPVVPAAEAKKQ
jgi:hypothetical protein